MAGLKSPFALTVLLASLGAALAVAVSGCGAEHSSPLPNNAERAQFETSLSPLLREHCGSCHGVSEQAFTRVAEEAHAGTLLRWPVLADGDIPDDSVDEVRGILRLWLDPSSPLLASPLLRATLPSALSGLHHPAIFVGLEDADFRVLRQWSEDSMPERAEAEAPVSAAAKFFAEKMTPLLSRKTCFSANCHGTLAFNDLRLDSGMPLLEDNPFTARMNQRNRAQMLGTITQLVNLSGDVEASRQIQKCIPIEQGGIIHKGGNAFLEVGDPDYQIFLTWLELEAKEARERSAMPTSPDAGFVFVRRPRNTPERFFEDASFLPGADLYWQMGTSEVNLTAKLHPDGPADVRAPDVSYDGRFVAFAMRRSSAESFNLWEIEFETGNARQITFSEDPEVHCQDPLYVPDPADHESSDLSRVNIVFTSNRSGEWCLSSPEAILGEATGGGVLEILDPHRTEPSGAFVGCQLSVLLGSGADSVRTIVRSEPGSLWLDEPLPAPADSTTHYAIAAEARMAPKYDAWRIARAAAGTERAVWESSLARMTWSPSQVRRPAMRSSGEVMFTCLRTGWQSSRPYFNGALFRVHVDGSNFHTHNGNRSAVPILAGDRELPNGLEVRIGRDADSWWGGSVIISDHQFGPTIEEHNPQDDLTLPYLAGTPEHSLPRFFPGWIELDRDAAFGGISPGGAYRDPYPLPDGSILISWAPGPVDLHDPEAAPNFDIVRLVPEPSFHSSDGLRAGEFRREVIVAGPDAELWARPVLPRLKEPVHKTLKTEPGLLGKPNEDPSYPRYPEGTPALVEIYDLPMLAAFFEQVTPFGPKHLATDECPICGETNGEVDRITAVRLVGSLPLRNGEPGPARRVVLAEQDLARDGSVYLTLPSQVAFDIQALNPLGMSVAMPNRWLYCLPGERHTLSIPRVLFPQTCGGCHGALNGRREDTLQSVDAVTAASRTLAIWDSAAGEKLRPANWQNDHADQNLTPDFERTIVPILSAQCTSCHPEFSGPHAYDALLPYVEYREAMAVKSPLLEVLLGRELHAPGELTNRDAHSGLGLTQAEVSAFIRWVDLGAAPGEDSR